MSSPALSSVQRPAAGLLPAGVDHGLQHAGGEHGVEHGAAGQLLVGVFLRDGQARDGLAVAEQLGLVAPGTDLHAHGLALAAGPVPAGGGARPAPGVENRLVGIVRRLLHGNEELGAVAHDQLAVIALRRLLAGNVKVGVIGDEPGIITAAETALGIAVAIFSNAGLAKIIPRGPDKVADDAAVFGDQLPVVRQILRESFCAHRDPVGKVGAVIQIAVGSVVIAADVLRFIGLRWWTQ